MYNLKKESTFWDKWDKPLTGFIIGILVPVIAYFIICSSKYVYSDFSSFMSVLLRKYNDPVILKASVFPNLPIFLILNIFKKHLICNGLFFASLLFIIPMLIIRYL
ncbi:MAG: hypothetical protein M9887_10480 [Chitinophagales bacterium]|nr:hypothetical protein [Chitinophagales bacterium]